MLFRSFLDRHDCAVVALDTGVFWIEVEDTSEVEQAEASFPQVASKSVPVISLVMRSIGFCWIIFLAIDKSLD